MGVESSILKGNTINLLLIAKFSSLATCVELLEFSLNTNTNDLLLSIALLIDSAQSLPGRISRGASQHLILFASSVLQIAFAIFASFEEWLINTSILIFIHLFSHGLLSRKHSSYDLLIVQWGIMKNILSMTNVAKPSHL